MPFSCSFRGECVPDYDGVYDTLVECQEYCTGSENIDLIYLILSYDWSKARQLLPVDKQELIWREFRLQVDPLEAERIIYMLADRDFRTLLTISPVFREYVEERITDFEIFALEAIEIIQVNDIYWPDYVRDVEMGIRRLLERYNPLYYSLDSLAINIASLLGSLARDSFTYFHYQDLTDLAYGWLPELIRLLAPAS